MTATMHPPAFDYYPSATAPAPIATATLADFIEGIQSDEFAATIAKLRAMIAAGDDDGYSVAKKSLPAVSISGHVTKGGRAKAMEENRFEHSGYLQLDFDEADNIGWTTDEIVEILKAESRIVAAFVSPSGFGVKGIALIPQCATRDEHVACFAAARQHFSKANLTIDEACKDPVRLMFVSHDPNAWCDLSRTATFSPADIQPDLPQAKPGLVLSERKFDFPEPPTQGIHTWCMEAAWWCRIHGFTEKEAENRIQSYDGQLRRPLQPTEARDAAQKAYAAPYKSKETWTAEQEAKAADDLLERAYALQFDVNSPPPPDEVVMALDDIPIAARGNLTVIQGQSKVGKSAVISAILGAAVRGQRRADGDTLCMNWREEATGSILHLDTEQSRADWHQLVIRAVLRGGVMDYSRLRSLPLIPFSRNERFTILKRSLEKERNDHGRVDCVILDGVADICNSPNDEEESLNLVSALMTLAQDYHCPVFCVLHENPSAANDKSGKTRGHLGSELNRKAFANLRIDKDASTSISTIYGSDMRKRDIPREQGFCFGWDDEAKMHVFLARASDVRSMAKTEKLSCEARTVMQSGRSYSYSEMAELLVRKLDVSDRTAKRRITVWEAEGIVFKTSQGRYMLVESNDP